MVCHQLLTFNLNKFEKDDCSSNPYTLKKKKNNNKALRT